MILMPDLFSFAYVPNWYSQLDMLAEMSLPEPWRFKNPIYLTKNPDTPILERYIHAIFKKQLIDYKDERNPSSAADYFHIENEFCCFHTGLYTRRYPRLCLPRKHGKASTAQKPFLAPSCPRMFTGKGGGCNEVPKKRNRGGCPRPLPQGNAGGAGFHGRPIQPVKARRPGDGGICGRHSHGSCKMGLRFRAGRGLWCGQNPHLGRR